MDTIKCLSLPIEEGSFDYTIHPVDGHSQLTFVYVIITTFLFLVRLKTQQKELSARSDRVKSVDIYPAEVC